MKARQIKQRKSNTTNHNKHMK